MLSLGRRQEVIEDPPVARALFGDTRLSWLWLLVRLYLSYSWITASLHKLEDPAWTVTGNALKGYWTNAVGTPDKAGLITFGWYRDFLSMLLNGGHYVWFAKLVAFGEMAIGIGLLIGAFVGVAAFFGGFMNWNFMLAGTTSTNPVLFALSVLLILAWKTAGFWGLDRFLLPMLGTPWRPSSVFTPGAKTAQARASSTPRT
ncbi:MAG TPA: DoxX family protein [Chloroflexota bacterium]|nr:DoxX family protein [Chloroflexota bacterium]